MANYDGLHKNKTDFILKRCQGASLCKKKRSEKILSELLDKLGDYEKKLLLDYIDEVNAEASENEENIYSTGFFDGVYLSFEYLN